MDKKLITPEEYETTIRLERIFDLVVPYHKIGFLVYDGQKSGLFAQDGLKILVPIGYKHIEITERFPYGKCAIVIATKEDGSKKKLKIEY